MQTSKFVTAAVEGISDEAVLGRILSESGLGMGAVYGKRGKSYLRQRIPGFNHAARHSPWVILVDLDHDFPCAVAMKRAWVPHPSRCLCLRVAVREVEAWLLADRERFASFLAVPITRIPLNPDGIPEPKQVVVNLAAGSRRREIRLDMVPAPGSLRPIGPAYASRLIEFATRADRGWRPRVAAKHSDSLNRCLNSISALCRRIHL